jgi:L-lactate dehydrogenase complex protein LldG
MSARATILQRVRDAQRTAFIPAVSVDHHATTLQSRPAPAGDDSLHRFLMELSALGVEQHVETTPEAVRTRVAGLVQGLLVLSWDADRLPYDIARCLPVGAATGDSPRDVQAAAGIGVTGCRAAIAETGSLAILSGAGMPRAASLLPPVHLCIVRQDQIVPAMGEFFRMCSEEIAEAACCTFVTGPSRTADIELTLTLGVHGPGRVIVVIGP